jgi:hypothetical protein
MNSKSWFPMLLLAIASLAAPARAIEAQSSQSTPAQAQLTTRQVLEACVQNRAETLPNPFTDVPANHWAFKAVLTMHYCGAFRQATPRSLIERLSNEQPASSQKAPDTRSQIGS